MPPSSRLEELLALLRAAGPASLGPGRRAAALDLPPLERSLAPLLEGIGAEDAALIRALVLLWHDHLDTSHEISQGIAGADASFVHGIMHRREPDYWNSKYWFRRAGKHPAFREIASRVSKLPASDPSVPWEPFAFVDAVEAACGHPGTGAPRPLLREAQQIEFEVLLGHFVSRA